MSFFKRLFGRKEKPAEEEVVPAEERIVYPASPEHFAIIEAPPPPGPVAEEEPPVAEEEQLPEPEPVAEEEPLPEPEPVAEEEPLAEPQPTVESPAIVEEPAPELITVARLDEAAALEALERALDELGSAHHRPFSRS